ncbi:MAG: hypothetical protein HY557_03110, partial [Euryarchaeota archaeon]|nr:hypothetical protein [Euryarchaeota archaeon]
MDLRIVPFDAKAAPREEWRQFHAWRRLRREETDPGEPVLSDESIERLLRRDHPEWQEFRFAALDPERPDAIIGFIWFEVSRPGGASHETNKHLGWVTV